MELKQKRQRVQATKMMKMHGDDLGAIEIGSLVTLKMDHRDVTHPRGVSGVVFRVSTKDPGSIAVMTAAGVVAHGPKKKVYHVPSDH